MPNYTMQTRRFDFFGFILLAPGMATPDPGARRAKRAGDFTLMLGILVALGVTAILWYLWHARGNDRALFSLNLFKTRPTVWACSAALPDASAAACCRL
jgi:DHA2 family multidrug resistance protein-like MFS transporter